MSKKKYFIKKKNEKTRFSFQSGPNLMSFAFKRGGRVKFPIFLKFPIFFIAVLSEKSYMKP